MVELRKRKEPPPGQAPPAIKKANSVKSSTSASNKKEESSPAEPTPKKLAAGDQISLDAFGGEIETHDGEKTSLKKLVEDSKAGVVLFTYPKASTPGCTTQACLFRDEFTPLTATGFSIFGLSTDSPKSNTTFKVKQNLPYTLLCDPKATLISAIGMKKAPSGTTRGVVVINKEGKVEAAEPGGPAATVEVVRKLVGSGDANASGEAKEPAADIPTEQIEASVQAPEPAKVSNGDAAKAEVAAEVADSAEKLDEGQPGKPDASGS